LQLGVGETTIGATQRLDTRAKEETIKRGWKVLNRFGQKREKLQMHCGSGPGGEGVFCNPLLFLRGGGGGL